MNLMPKNEFLILTSLFIKSNKLQILTNSFKINFQKLKLNSGLIFKNFIYSYNI